MRGYLDHTSQVIPADRLDGRVILVELGIKGVTESFGVLVKEVG